MQKHEPNNVPFHRQFLASERPHIVMISNHGVHEWRIVPGLPDTGGQVVFVNEFAKGLAAAGYRVTIVNRGGYQHPQTKELRRGVIYRGPYQRILCLEDGRNEFVRKEDMADQMPALVEDLIDFFGEKMPEIELIISHYWDAAELANRWRQATGSNRLHVWVPHSLGAIKKRNVAPEEWARLRIDERIEAEREILNQVDAAATTSSTIRNSLLDDYEYEGPLPFLPPSVDPDRYRPRAVEPDDPIWSFLAERSRLSDEEIRSRQIVTEISRTDTTKRKDILLRAFANARESMADILLVVSIDDSNRDLSAELHAQIDRLELADEVIVVGSIWDELPTLYAITSVYCTPSIMEGFGMSAQEAAATAVPVIASPMVPFASEYLLGSDVRQVASDNGGGALRIGAGAIVAPADDPAAFGQALRLILHDADMQRRMGRAAYRITIPDFTWGQRIRAFLGELSLPVGGSDA
ncbi:MAG: glycosyltransferase [Anaerolineales bacterium]